MTLHRVIHALDVAEAKLNRVVAILGFRLDLDNDARTGLDHGHAARLAVLREHLGHADLAAEECVSHSLISMSTPAGSCRRMSVSTVREDGSMMSISRLC